MERTPRAGKYSRMELGGAAFHLDALLCFAKLQTVGRSTRANHSGRIREKEKQALNRQKLIQQAIGVTLVVLLLSSCGMQQSQPTPTSTPVPPTATPTPVPPTAVPTPVPLTNTPITPTVSISLSAQVPEWAAGKMELKVLIGGYQLTSGATARAGSLIYVYEDALTLPMGLMIDVGIGGVTLKGISYTEGTRLFVYESGILTKMD